MDQLEILGGEFNASRLTTMCSLNKVGRQTISLEPTFERRATISDVDRATNRSTVARSSLSLAANPPGKLEEVLQQFANIAMGSIANCASC